MRSFLVSDKLVKILSTWFYVGDLPGAPGTAASAVAVLMAVIFAPNIFLYILVTIIVTVLGFKVSGRMEAILGKKDPGCIVIDEVAGIMVAAPPRIRPSSTGRGRTANSTNPSTT